MISLTPNGRCSASLLLLNALGLASQGRAVGVVAGASRAFGRRTQGVWGAGPPTAGGELSGYQALKPPQINIDLTKSLKYEFFVLPKLDYF